MPAITLHVFGEDFCSAHRLIVFGRSLSDIAANLLECEIRYKREQQYASKERPGPLAFVV